MNFSQPFLESPMFDVLDLDFEIQVWQKYIDINRLRRYTALEFGTPVTQG